MLDKEGAQWEKLLADYSKKQKKPDTALLSVSGYYPDLKHRASAHQYAVLIYRHIII